MIKAAAIKRTSDGKVWTGRNHGEIIQRLIEGGEKVTRGAHLHGFVTDDGVFVDRFKAFEIARACWQLKNPGISRDPADRPALISEEVKGL